MAHAKERPVRLTVLEAEQEPTVVTWHPADHFRDDGFAYCYQRMARDGFRCHVDPLRQGKLADGFTARDVRRNQWRSLTTDESVQAALDWLEDEDWLRAEEVGGTGPGTGRRTYRYAINPKAGKSGGDHG